MANMALSFSTNNLSEMFAEAQQQTGAACWANPDESLYTLDKPFGRLAYRHIHLREGLELSISRLDLRENLRVIQKTEDYSTLELSFCMTGEFQGRYHAPSMPQSAGPGKNFVSLLQGDIDFTNDYSARHPISVLTINVAPSRLGELMPNRLDYQALGETVSIQTAQAEIFGTIGWTTPTMLAAIQQILSCPYQGKIKQIYLESKVLELIALKLEQVRQRELHHAAKTELKSDDLHRLYRAREILLADIEHPPSILELAKQVSINDFKLKRGFRQVFGTTVFGCLYDYRMERAKQLLDTQSLQVAQIAQTVGYANPSQFAAAFKRKFGVSPKVYRTQHHQ